MYRDMPAGSCRRFLCGRSPVPPVGRHSGRPAPPDHHPVSLCPSRHPARHLHAQKVLQGFAMLDKLPLLPVLKTTEVRSSQPLSWEWFPPHNLFQEITIMRKPAGCLLPHLELVEEAAGHWRHALGPGLEAASHAQPRLVLLHNMQRAGKRLLCRGWPSLWSAAGCPFLSEIPRNCRPWCLPCDPPGMSSHWFALMIVLKSIFSAVHCAAKSARQDGNVTCRRRVVECRCVRAPRGWLNRRNALVKSAHVPICLASPATACSQYWNLSRTPHHAICYGSTNWYCIALWGQKTEEPTKGRCRVRLLPCVGCSLCCCNGCGSVGSSEF